MKRSDRRRFESEFKTMLKKFGDNCSICKMPLQHNVKTFGGVTIENKTALTADCCKEKLVSILREGVYLTKNFDSIPNFPPQSHKVLDVENPSEIVNSIQAHFDKLEGVAENLMARAGVTSSRHEVCVSDNAWKSDDAEWFKNNPSRSHRLRRVFVDELSALPKDITQREMSNEYRLDILVRQISPGQRARLPIWLYSAIDVPDDEAVIHAIFDLASKKGRVSEITLDEIQKMAKEYGASQRLN